jgi:predicted Zn-dependent peptidase
LGLPRPGSTLLLSGGTDDDPSSGAVRRTVLPGGLRVVTEQVPGARSASFGVWVGVGSRDESAEEAGCSHFLEHLLFKGTARRSALEIASVIDAVGGETNAFTGKEYTCYYARVLAEDLPLAVDVVGDLVTSSLVTEDDVEVERGVILEEIAMHDDDPGDVVHDTFAAALWGDAPLGRPVIGTVDSIEGLSRDTIARFYAERYTPDRMVVAAAGALDHATVVAQVQQVFGPRLAGDVAPAPRRSSAGGPEARSRVLTQRRPTEQAHVVLGTAGVHREDPRRFALSVLSTALGGGMSSRLFQEVREKRGLAYSVYSFATSYADTGDLGVYAGCAPGKVDEVLDVCRTELAAVAERGLTDEELRRAKGSLRGGLVLGLEDTGSRMSRLGKGELVHEHYLSVDDVLARTDAVTGDEVLAVARDLLAQPMALGVIGPFDRRHDLPGAVA